MSRTAKNERLMLKVSTAMMLLKRSPAFIRTYYFDHLTPLYICTIGSLSKVCAGNKLNHNLRTVRITLNVLYWEQIQQFEKIEVEYELKGYKKIKIKRMKVDILIRIGSSILYAAILILRNNVKFAVKFLSLFSRCHVWALTVN